MCTPQGLVTGTVPANMPSAQPGILPAPLCPGAPSVNGHPQKDVVPNLPGQLILGPQGTDQSTSLSRGPRIRWERSLSIPAAAPPQPRPQGLVA